MIFVSANTQIVYINSNVTGAANGSSWGNAYTDLKDALEVAKTGEIWVASGVYKPTGRNDREANFELQPNVDIYGGFPAEGI